MGGNTIYAVICTNAKVGSVLFGWGGLELLRGLGCAVPGLDVSMAAAKTTPFAQNLFFFVHHLDHFFPGRHPAALRSPKAAPSTPRFSPPGR